MTNEEYKLTDKMIDTLKQVGFGVTFRAIIGGSSKAAFYDENNDRVDTRSLNALAKRGLVYGGTTSGYSLIYTVQLTEKGETLFDEILDKEAEKRRRG